MSERLELLRPILDQYKRRFTVLDLGAGIEGYQNIGAEIAREYDAVCVMVERDWDKDKFIPSPRTIVLKHNIDQDGMDLDRLSQCEHFDVVLAFNFSHWFKIDATVVLMFCQQLGQHLFVQIPDVDDGVAGEEFGYGFLEDQHERLNHAGKVIGETVQFPGHRARKIWHIEYKQDKKLTRTHLGAHKLSSTTIVHADYRHLIAFHKGQWIKWVPGVNLSNALKLNMVWPEREVVVEKLKRYPMPERRHGDITLHNFVFDGEKLLLVDGYADWGGEDRENMDKVIKQVEMA